MSLKKKKTSCRQVKLTSSVELINFKKKIILSPSAYQNGKPVS
jgi:hypothetical protein